MTGFHAFWTKPAYGRTVGPVELPDHDLVTAILSALKWREFNGEMILVTDSRGAEYVCRNRLEWVWDRIDCSLDSVPNTVDPFLFWAAGKLYALQSMDCPCAMVDMDLIIWKCILPMLGDAVVAAHCEELNRDVYPEESTLKCKPGYRLPEEWDYTLLPANTAFLYMPSDEFRDCYVNSALDFIFGISTENLDPVTAMCYAEQRILPLCAARSGVRVNYLADVNNLDGQDFVTHIWGYKQLLRESKKEEMAFCRDCVQRIVEDYPACGVHLANCPPLWKYLF